MNRDFKHSDLNCFDTLNYLIASFDRFNEIIIKTNYIDKRCSNSEINYSCNQSLEKNVVNLHINRTNNCSRNVILIARLYNYLKYILLLIAISQQSIFNLLIEFEVIKLDEKLVQNHTCSKSIQIINTHIYVNVIINKIELILQVYACILSDSQNLLNIFSKFTIICYITTSVMLCK